MTTYIVYDEYNQFTSTMYPSTPIAALMNESGLIPKQQITEEKKLQISIWYEQKTKQLEASRWGFYIPGLKQIHPLLGKAKYLYASWCYQLKTGDGAIGNFLEQIAAVESAECWWCRDWEQPIMHLYTRR